MARPMRVWACSIGNFDLLVAAPTKKAAAAAMGMTLYSFNQYASETWNKEQLALALAQPGVVYRRSNRGAFNANAYEVKP